MKGGILGSILAGDIPEMTSLQLQTEAQNLESYKGKGIAERIKELNPNKCRLWKFADRPEEEATHAQEIALSIKDVDQINPAIVRPLSKNDPDYPEIEYEIIAGSVRWRAAKINGTQLKVIIRNLDDKEAISIMVAENEHRREISPFARSLQIKRVWDSGLYSSQDELALAHHMEKSKISMYLKVASNADYLRQLFAEKINSIGLRQLYDSCNHVRPRDREDKTIIPVNGIVVKTNKQGITTIKFNKKVSDETLQKIKEIIENES